MNFFEAQDNARRKTWQLLLLFAAAVISLILMTNLLVAAVAFYSNSAGYVDPASVVDRVAAMPPETWALISFGVISVVGLASLYKYLSLRGGGRAIAEMLGGRPMSYDNTHGNSRRLLNIVEEMAIASGIPVPPVYLIDEPSINAFAAGFNQDDAVIGVNQGTIDQLNRDELQGVIAHEFSHIVNGDTRINLRLIAALHGIIFLSMIGHSILRGMRFSGGSRNRKGGGSAPIIALGVGLLLIGYAGTFFGNLIKAAVSRQREYLADAAAVQFTRNPDGIANALKRIGGLSEGSTVSVVSADEASHQFFGQIHPFFLNSIMATHPPLPKRIKAIEPRWDGDFLAPRIAGLSAAAGSDRDAAGDPSRAAGASALAGAMSLSHAGPQEVVDQVGTLSPSGLEVAQNIIESTDSRLRDAAHDTWGSRGLIYAMLIDPETKLSESQRDYLLESAEPGVPEYTATLLDDVAALDPSRKLTLIEMAMPALKGLSKPQYERFVGNCIKLIKADGRISLFEWVLHRVLLKELQPHFEGPRPVRVKHRNLKAVASEAAVLLSVLARIGSKDAAAVGNAFAAGADAFGIALTFSDAEDPNFQNLNAALSELRALKPLLKPKLLKACAATVLADDEVSSAEGALLQGVAAALDCPLPPSIYGQSATS